MAVGDLASIKTSALLDRRQVGARRLTVIKSSQSCCHARRRGDPISGLKIRKIFISTEENLKKKTGVAKEENQDSTKWESDQEKDSKE